MKRRKKKSLVHEKLPKSRFLEKLVEVFESALGPSTKVKSPDRILDTITGQEREVDISLRAEVGSNQVLVMVECRNRDGVEDVTWVEQVKAKRDDIRADKAVMVTNKPMSSPAQRKAEHHGISIRTVDESVEDDDFRSWLGVQFRGFVLSKIHSRLTGWTFVLDEGELERAFPEGPPVETVSVTPEEMAFRLNANKDAWNINQVWQTEGRLVELAPKLREDSRRPFKLSLTVREENRYYFLFKEQELAISEFQFEGEAWLVNEYSLPTTSYTYKDQTNTPMAHLVSHFLELPTGKIHSMSVIFDARSSQYIFRVESDKSQRKK